MKKKIIGMAIIATIVLSSAWNIIQNNEIQFSSLAFNNVEALADTEVDVGEPCILYPTTCYEINDDLGHDIITGYR